MQNFQPTNTGSFFLVKFSFLSLVAFTLMSSILLNHIKEKEDTMNDIMKKENGKQPATFGSVVDQIFQNNLSRFFDDQYWSFEGLNKFQSPLRGPVNIRETDKTYEMELFAPGFNKQDFRLNLEGDQFIISVENPEQNKSEERKDGWLRVEYKQQGFTRTFNIDDAIDATKIAARYENGVLCLSFPKKEHAQKVARNIRVE